MFPALRHRNFRLFFLGQFVSLVGSWMQNTAQAWLVYRLTGDPLMLGLVAFVGQFPVFVLGFYAGFAVDHADHLRLVKRTQFLAMVQAALLALLTWGITSRSGTFSLSPWASASSTPSTCRRGRCSSASSCRPTCATTRSR
ncbi:MAG: MFS transporter [Elusimicrobiota bacterium]|nr:MAG: MFS transporter [Elusimicrobiota bacterium]